MGSNTLTIGVTCRVSYKRQKLLSLRGRLGSPPGFVGVCIDHLFSFLCRNFSFVRLRPVYPMLSVSLDYPFLIAPSLFSSSSPRVPNVASVSGLPILDCPIAFLLVFAPCTQCCQCLWITHSWLPHRFSPLFIWLSIFFYFLLLAYRCTSWTLFLKRVMCTKLYIYVFIRNALDLPLTYHHCDTNNCFLWQHIIIVDISTLLRKIWRYQRCNQRL